MGDSSSSSAARPPRHRPPPADPARLHISRLCALTGALKISQLVTTGRARRPFPRTCRYTPPRASHSRLLSWDHTSDNRAASVCRSGGYGRGRTGGRTEGEGGRTPSSVSSSSSYAPSLVHGRRAERHIFRANFANCVKRTNDAPLPPSPPPPSLLAPPRARLPGNLLETGRKSRAVRGETRGREGRRKGGRECSANYSRPLFSLILSLFLPFCVAAEFQLRLTAPPSHPSLRTSPVPIHLCRPTPTGFSLRMSRRISKPAPPHAGVGSGLHRCRCSVSVSLTIANCMPEKNPHVSHPRVFVVAAV